MSLRKIAFFFLTTISNLLTACELCRFPQKRVHACACKKKAAHRNKLFRERRKGGRVYFTNFASKNFDNSGSSNDALVVKATATTRLLSKLPSSAKRSPAKSKATPNATNIPPTPQPQHCTMPRRCKRHSHKGTTLHCLLAKHNMGKRCICHALHAQDATRQADEYKYARGKGESLQM